MKSKLIVKSMLIVKSKLILKSMLIVRATCKLASPSSLPRWVGSALIAGLLASSWCDSTALSTVAAPVQETPTPLTEYLTRLQLKDLLLEHLEDTVAQEVDEDRRLAAVAQLAQAYTQRMMSGQTPRDDGQAPIAQRAEQLIQTYPHLATTEMRLAIQQTQYQLAEQEFRSWWKAGQSPATQSVQLDRFRTIRDALSVLQAILDERYEAQLSLLQANAGVLGQEAESARLLQLESQQWHLNYLQGWTNYFMGVLTPTDRNNLMLAADQAFRNFLRLQSNRPLTDLDRDAFDLNSAWSQRALVGLAMAQQGLDRDTGAQHCFSLLRTKPTDTTVDGEPATGLIDVWEFQSHAYLNHYSAAEAFVRQRATRTKGRTTKQEVSIPLWLASLEGATSFASNAPLVAGRLSYWGMRGLAIDFQAESLRDFVDRNQINTDVLDVRANVGDDRSAVAQQPTFLIAWIGGYLDFAEADVASGLRRSSQLELSRKKLERALELATADTSGIEIGYCRFLLGRVAIAQARLEQAIEQLETASTLLELYSPELSAEAQWLAINAASRLAAEDGRYRADSNAAIADLLTRFPDSAFASRAKFERERLLAAELPTDQAIERLEQFSVGNPSYLLARHEIARRRYDACVAELSQQSTPKRDTNSAPDSFQSSLDLLVTEVEGQLRSEGIPTELKLRSIFWVVDVLLKQQIRQADLLTEDRANSAAGGVDKVQDWLEQARPLALSLTSTSPIYFEFRFQLFRFHSLQADLATAAVEANWLANNAADSPFVEPALVFLAQHADQRLRAEATDENTAMAVAAYMRLAKHLGDSPDVMRRSTNARVATFRLAQLHLQSGNANRAVQLLRPLSSAFPQQRSYLSELAAAEFAAENFPAAILCYRRLTAAAIAGGDDWFAAKTKLIDALARNGDLDDAIGLFRQTQLLSPNVPEKWQATFAELSSRLELD